MITLDTNIYISAIRFGGKPKELLQKAVGGHIQIAVSELILDETLEVFQRKFRFSPGMLSDARKLIKSCTTLVTPTKMLNVIVEDESTTAL